MERWKLCIKSDVHGPACGSFKSSWEMRETAIGVTQKFIQVSLYAVTKNPNDPFDPPNANNSKQSMDTQDMEGNSVDCDV